MVRVKVSRITSRSSGTDAGPVRPFPLDGEGVLVCFVALTSSHRHAMVREPEGATLRERVHDAIREGKPLAIEYADRTAFWTTPVTQIDRGADGLPDEVLTRSGSLYRITYLTRIPAEGVPQDLPAALRHR